MDSRSPYVGSLLTVVTAVLVTISILLLSFGTVGNVFAQSEATPPEEPAGTVNCFDYYKFGWIQAQIYPLYTEGLYGGDQLPFKGNLVNQNPYPVVDGQLYMKVFKLGETDESEHKRNGSPLIDFVLLKDGIVIPAVGETAVEFKWQIPNSVATGDYKVAFFFTTAHKFNLLGLSFTDDVVGNSVTFPINIGYEYNPVTFDKNTVKLNEVEHSFALPARHFAKDEEITLYANLINDSDEVRKVDLTWTTFKWDGILETNKHGVEGQTIELEPNSKTGVSFKVPTLDTSVTFVEAEVKDKDASSLLQVRFLRDGISEIRINYPSLYNYPLTAGEEATLFSCVHATNEPVVPDSSLTLELKDSYGKTIHTYTYEGGITGDMMGVKDTFVPERNIVNLSLIATLKHAGQVVESVTVEYKCTDIDPSLCALEPSPTPSEINKLKSSLDLRFIPVSILVLVLIAVGVIFYIRRKRNGSQGDAYVDGGGSIDISRSEGDSVSSGDSGGSDGGGD